jgi:hypothetical protein
MSALAILSVVSLLVVGGLAMLGVFASSYHDSFLERVGMSAVALWCLVRVCDTLTGGANEDAQNWPLHVGLALFAVGFAFEVRKRFVKES